MGQDLGHSIEDRRQNGLRVCRLCHYLDRQGINVVCAIPFAVRRTASLESRELVRLFRALHRSADGCAGGSGPERPVQRGARAGRIANVAGFDIPFKPPENPDMIVRNDQDLAQIDAIASAVFEEVKPRLKVKVDAV